MYGEADACPIIANALGRAAGLLEAARHDGTLSPQECRLIEVMLTSGKRAGAHLPTAAQRQEVAAMFQREAELCGQVSGQWAVDSGQWSTTTHPSIYSSTTSPPHHLTTSPPHHLTAYLSPV